MELKPQDVLVALKLVALGGQWQPYQLLAEELGMSPSQVHAAVQRAIAARLIRSGRQHPKPVHHHLRIFLLYGIRYAFIPERGGLTTGIPTGLAAPMLADLRGASRPVPLVWPDAGGDVRGESLMPLHPAAPQAARGDPRLYTLLALVDGIRAGGPSERREAGVHLARHLREPG